MLCVDVVQLILIYHLPHPSLQRPSLSCHSTHIPLQTRAAVLELCHLREGRGGGGGGRGEGGRGRNVIIRCGLITMDFTKQKIGQNTRTYVHVHKDNIWACVNVAS